MNKIKLLKRNKKAETEKKEVIEKMVLKIPGWMVGAFSKVCQVPKFILIDWCIQNRKKLSYPLVVVVEVGLEVVEVGLEVV